MVAMLSLLVCARAAPIAASMAIKRPRGDQPAPLAAAALRRMADRRLSCLARNAVIGVLARLRRGVVSQGKKVDGPPLREGDRGIADPRPDQPIRGRAGRPADRPRRT